MEVVRQLAGRGHVVYLGSREPRSGSAAAEPLLTTGLEVRSVTLDVTDPATLDALAARLFEERGRLDVLVNNAAIHYDSWESVVGADLATVREAIETNVLGAWQTPQALLPLMRCSSHARIINVSSGAGSLTDMGGGIPAYRITTASLNALTKMWAAELTKPPILVNSICPGWVATDTWAAPADDPSRRAPRASSGPPPSQTTCRPADSSETSTQSLGSRAGARARAWLGSCPFVRTSVRPFRPDRRPAHEAAGGRSSCRRA